jgi:hypothetical protein
MWPRCCTAESCVDCIQNDAAVAPRALETSTNTAAYGPDERRNIIVCFGFFPVYDDAALNFAQVDTFLLLSTSRSEYIKFVNFTFK